MQYDRKKAEKRMSDALQRTSMRKIKSSTDDIQNKAVTLFRKAQTTGNGIYEENRK